MHIVFYGFVTNYGGAPQSTVELASRLAEHVKVSVVDPYGSCRQYAQAVEQSDAAYEILQARNANTVIGAQGGGLRRAVRVLRAMPNLMRIRRLTSQTLRRIDPSVVVVNNHKSLMMVASCRRLRHVPLVAYMRGWYTPDMIPPYAMWAYRRRCARLLAVSHPTKAALSCSGLDPSRIAVLHNPVDVNALLVAAEAPLKAPLEQADRPVRILLPANILRTKGQHTAVQAMRPILDAGLDAVLWLAGGLPHGNEDTYVRRTRRLADKLGVAQRVVWLGYRSDIPQVIKAATMVVLPSHSEGLPRTVMEAMAIGRPIAATGVGGVLDLILPGVTGWSFEVEDAAGLADCVIRSAQDPERSAEMCRAAQQYMRESFTPTDQTRRALALLGAF